VAATRDAASQASGNGVSSLTWSHTCTGSDLALKVGTSCSGNVTGVTYNGVALTLLREDIDGSFGFESNNWGLVNPATGAHDVVVTIAAASDIVAGGQSAISVDQATPFIGATGANGNGTTASVVVAAATDDLVFDTAMSLTDLTMGAGQTLSWDLANGAGMFGGGSTEPGAASVTMSWTLATQSWAISAGAFKASAGAGGTGTPLGLLLALTAVAGGSVVVTMGVATLTIATFAPTVLTPVVVTPGLVALTLTTFAPTVSTPVVVTMNVTTLTTASFAPTVVTPVLVTMGVASLTLSTFAPNVTIGFIVVMGTASIITSTFAPNVTVTNNILVTMGVASLTIATFAPSVLTPVVVTMGQATLTIATFVPIVSTPRVVTMGVASLVTATFVPTIINPQSAVMGLATLTLTTFAPSALVTVLVTMGVASLTTTTFVPTVSTPVLVTVGKATLTTSTFVPSVVVNVIVVMGQATLTTATFVPTVSTPRVAIMGTLALATTTFAPAVTVAITVVMGVATLTVTRFAPTVSTPVVATMTTASLVLTRFAPTITSGNSVVVVMNTAHLILTTYAFDAGGLFGETTATVVRRAASTAVVSLLLTYVRTVIEDNPVLYWRLGETSGAVAQDSSGNGRHGTYVGTLGMGVAGPLSEPSGAVDLPGTIAAYVIRDPAGMGGSLTEFSVEWFGKWESGAPGSPRGMFGYSVAGNNTILPFFNAAGTGYDAWIQHIPLSRSCPTPFDGSFHHWLYSWRSSDGLVELWRDGMLVDTFIHAGTVGLTIADDGAWVLGQEQDAQGGGFDANQAWIGPVGEFSVYRTMLSASRVVAHYNAGKYGFDNISAVVVQPKNTALASQAGENTAVVSRRIP